VGTGEADRIEDVAPEAAVNFLANFKTQPGRKTIQPGAQLRPGGTATNRSSK